MAAIFYDPVFLEHETGMHPERPERLRAIVDRLRETGLWDETSHPECPEATGDDLRRVHAAEMIALVRRVAEKGGGGLDPDTVVSPRSYEAALKAAGAAVGAVKLVASGGERTAFCLVRPPGHHATPTRSMGFCLFNNAAVAAAAALELSGIERVAIVDWDIHHGNGTQECFYSDGRVFYVSSHMYPHYPGSGRETETGAGEGEGTTLNVPLAPYTPAEEHVGLLRAAIEGPAAEFAPQLVIVSAGYDSGKGDPLGALMLEPRHFRELARECARLGGAGRGVVATLEGGYDLEALASGVEETLRGLME